MGETVLYQQMQLSMDQLRRMVLGLAAETRRLLVRDLLMLEVDGEGEAVRGLLAIDWHSAVDNPNERQVGWSFLEDIRNQFRTGLYRRHWLAQRVVEEKSCSCGSDSLGARGGEWE